MRGWVAYIAWAIATALCSQARAGAASRLLYSRTSSAAACPDERGFRAAVAERLGYDPFFPWAKQTVSVAMSQDKGVWRARIELVDEDGIVRGSRQLTGAAHDCGELLASLALATSIALDPMHAEKSSEPQAAAATKEAEHPAASPEPTAATENAEAKEAKVRAVQRRSERSLDEAPAAGLPMQALAAKSVLLSLRAGPVLTLGESPATALGARIGVKLEGGLFSVAGELRAMLPTSEPSNQGEAVANVWGATVAPCVGWHALSGCALLFAGTMNMSGRGVPSPRSESSFYAAAGGRVEASVALSRRIDLVANVDGLRVLTPLQAYLQQRQVWKTPPYTGVVGAAVAVHFP